MSGAYITTQVELQDFFKNSTSKIPTSIPTQFCWKAGGGERILLARYAGSYLPFLIPNSFTVDKHRTYITLCEMETLSLEMAPKCSGIKGGF